MKIRARPRQVPGGWLQATIRPGAVRAGTPAGYCAEHAGTPHATPEEASACWRRYLLEQTLALEGQPGIPHTRGDSGPCIVCGTVTNRTVVINGYPRGHWCDGHATVANVAAWWNAAGEPPQAPRRERQAAVLPPGFERPLPLPPSAAPPPA